MNMFNKLAEELKAIRIEKGISLDQVAAITRNNPKLLEAMEEGDFSFSDDIIVKAYYKEYVKAIGLDLPLYLQKFEAAKQGKDFDVPKKETPAKETPVEPTKEEIKKEEPIKPVVPPKKADKNFVEKDDQESLFAQHEETKKEPAQKRVISSTPPSRTSFNAVTNDVADYSSSKSNTGLIIAIAAAGVILLAAVAYFYFIKDNSAEIVHETPYEEVQSESENRFEETDSVIPEESTDQAAITDSMNLVISAKEQSWFEITIDSVNSTQMTLNANEERSFKGTKNFRLNTGNAQALGFMLNGQSLTYTTTKRAAKLFIDSAGVKELKTPKKVKTVNEQPGI